MPWMIILLSEEQLAQQLSSLILTSGLLHLFFHPLSHLQVCGPKQSIADGFPLSRSTPVSHAVLACSAVRV